MNIMVKYYFILLILTFASAFSQFNIILQPKYNIKNNILTNKYKNYLVPLNNKIVKYKLNELKNNRLQYSDLINYTITEYYLRFLPIC